MGDNQHSDIFKDTDCLSMNLMERYAADQLPLSERQRIEKHLVDCPICADALEGLTLAGFSSDVEERIASLNNRIASATQNRAVGFWKKSYYAYAAGFIGILIISGLLLNFLKTSNLTDPQLISQDLTLEEKNIEQDIPLASTAKDATEASGDELDALKSSKQDITTVGGIDKGESVPLQDQDVERLRNQLQNKEGGIVMGEVLNDAVQEDLSRTESADIQGTVASGLTTVNTLKYGKITADEEADNRRDAAGEDYRYKAKKEDKSKLDYGGLAKNDEPSNKAGDIATESDDFDQFYKEQEVSEEEEQPRAIREETTISSSQTLVVDESMAQPIDKVKTKDIPDKTAASRKSAEGRKSDQKWYLASGKEKDSSALKSGEHGDPNLQDNEPVPMEPESESVALETKAVTTTSEFQSSISSNESTIAIPSSASPALDSISIADQVRLSDDQAPMFQGGERDLKQYLEDNVVYPDAAEKLGIQCKVSVTFTVNADSTISNAAVVKPIGGGCDEEALRVVNKMPNWVPAQKKGRRITTQYNLEIDFESIKK